MRLGSYEGVRLFVLRQTAGASRSIKRASSVPHLAQEHKSSATSGEAVRLIFFPFVLAVPTASVCSTHSPCDPSRAARVASFSWLFETHRSGRIASPIVARSSNCRRSSSNVGSLVVYRRPAPFRRTLPANEPGSLRFSIPRPMALRATLVTHDVAGTPPCPAVRASPARATADHARRATVGQSGTGPHRL
jgi:hypothetical protein